MTSEDRKNIEDEIAAYDAMGIEKMRDSIRTCLAERDSAWALMERLAKWVANDYSGDAGTEIVKAAAALTEAKP